jgi:sugar phosphate isomerase/epimerase
MRLGGPVFVKSEDPEVLARAHRDAGYRAAYVPAVELEDKERVRAVVQAFAARDVVIAEVGAWVNMLGPDPSARRKNLAYVEKRLALAEELGARCCVDIAGSFNPEVWYGPDPRNLGQEFIDATVENCRRLIDAVKPRRTTFSIEMSPWNFPSSPDEYLKLIRAVDRQAFAVHVDICNLINSPYRMYDNAAVIGEVYQKLGRWIVSNHLKDLKWVTAMAMSFEETVPGRGRIDYQTWLRELSRLPVDAPLMLEHLKSEQEYDEGRRHIQGVARSLGLSFGTEA